MRPKGRQSSRTINTRHRAEEKPMPTYRERYPAIRKLLTEKGGEATIPDLVQSCFEAGIYSREECARLGNAGLARHVRAALREKDEKGLPFALPIPRRRRA